MAQSAPLGAAAPALQRDQLRAELAHTDLSFWLNADTGTSHIYGTRAQLEAEGLIPAGTIFPARDRTEWTAGNNHFALYAVRRPKAREMGREATAADCWCLAVSPLDTGDAFAHTRRRRLAAKLKEVARLVEPFDEAAWYASYLRREAARKDTAFQAFKASVLPQRNKPGRKPAARPSIAHQPGETA